MLTKDSSRTLRSISIIFFFVICSTLWIGCGSNPSNSNQPTKAAGSNETISTTNNLEQDKADSTAQGEDDTCHDAPHDSCEAFVDFWNCLVDAAAGSQDTQNATIDWGLVRMAGVLYSLCTCDPDEDNGDESPTQVGRDRLSQIDPYMDENPPEDPGKQVDDALDNMAKIVIAKSQPWNEERTQEVLRQLVYARLTLHGDSIKQWGEAPVSCQDLLTKSPSQADAGSNDWYSSTARSLNLEQVQKDLTPAQLKEMIGNKLLPSSPDSNPSQN